MQALDFMKGMGLGMVADQLADLKLGELLDTPPPGLDEAVAIAKVRCLPFVQCIFVQCERFEYGIAAGHAATAAHDCLLDASCYLYAFRPAHLPGGSSLQLIQGMGQLGGYPPARCSALAWCVLPVLIQEPTVRSSCTIKFTSQSLRRTSKVNNL